MISRQDLEKRELLTSAPYACRSSESRGRKHKEKEHPYRTRFQRDRDRIIHSTAFRRLEYKTQVFVNHEGDHYRTRLTHSLEGAQIGRTIARALGLNEDLVEAIVLAHDLGHGPFGHAGQDALAEMMKGHGGFEHNLQTLRIVDILENRYPNFEGLNLSYEVREGIMKHLTRYDKPMQAKLREFRLHESPTLEAQIGNIADEIAYDSHDLDDGFRSGLLSEDALNKTELWRRVSRTVKVKDTKKDDRHRARAVIRGLIDLQVSDLLKTSMSRIQKYKIRSLSAVRKHKGPIIGFSKELLRQKVPLKRTLWDGLYQHYRVARMSEKGRRVIRELFGVYLKHPEQIPPANMARQKGDGRYRVICDYIAGMTDRYALDEYTKLFDPHEKV